MSDDGPDPAALVASLCCVLLAREVRRQRDALLAARVTSDSYRALLGECQRRLARHTARRRVLEAMDEVESMARHPATGSLRRPAPQLAVQADTDVIELQLGLPKGVLTQDDLPALTAALQGVVETAVAQVVRGRVERGLFSGENGESS